MTLSDMLGETSTSNDGNGTAVDMATLTALLSSTMTIQIPQWMIDLHYVRKRLFLQVIEPIIVFLLGPHDDGVSNNHHHQHATIISHADQSHRRLGFLPSYVEDVNYLRASSMSFATLTMMYIIMSVILLVFLSCFYHNQKTSPLFVSPRRHRLPKLVPPPLPVDGAFSWVKVCLFMSLQTKAPVRTS